MPIVKLPIDAVYDSVTMPVAKSVLSDIKSFIGSSQDTKVILELENTDFKNKNWNLGKVLNIDKVGPKEEVLVMSFKESYEEQHSITTKQRSNDTKPVILDRVSRVFIRPMYIETKMNLSINIHNKSKTVITSTLNKLRLLFLNNRDVAMHSIQYFYNLQKPYLELLYDIYKIKKDMLEIDESFEEFLVPMVDDRFTITGNQSGNLSGISVAFKEIQHNVLGYFTSDLLNPDIQYDSNTNYYSTVIDYEFRYDRPTSLECYYNKTVYNMLLPSRYILTAARGSVEDYNNLY
jgi:hypothetical protein